jgi:hypothetical protein
MVQSGNSAQCSRSIQSQLRRDSTLQALSSGLQCSEATSETGLSYNKPSPGAFKEGNMVSTATVNMVNTNRIGEGNCFYCHNREPSFPPHKFWNQCPWYKFYLTQGTIHLNRANRLCLGLEREGAPEIFLTRDAPHCAQVCMCTIGTEFDENIKDHPKEQIVSEPSTAVQGLTFISEKSDSSCITRRKYNPLNPPVNKPLNSLEPVNRTGPVLINKPEPKPE